MATLQTYTVVTRREDLSDMIKLLNPNRNWFLDNAKSGKALNTYVEWALDELDTPTANTTQVEGFDAADSALTPTTRAGNYTEISKEDGKISNTQIESPTAGEHDTLDYQIMKSGKNLKNKIEYSLVINASATSGASGTARKTKGLIGWIGTNTSSASATGVNLSEDLFNDNLQLIWTECGDPSEIIHTICGAYQKRKFSDFTGVSSSAITIQAEKNKIVDSITVIETDFGLVNIHKHHVLNSNSAGTIINLFDVGCWEVAWLRKVKKIDLAPAGDNERFLLVGEYGLKAYQEKTAGRIFDLKSS